MSHGVIQTEGFLVESSHRWYLNLKEPGNPTNNYQRLARGFNNVDPQMNEEVDQTPYLDGNGFATSTVMGGQLTLAFTGHRYFGDPVQDWIFEHMIAVGPNRETDFYWVQPDGHVTSGDVTLAVINGPGGDANTKGEINVEIHFNGSPTTVFVAEPTNLVASNEMSTSIDLDWDAVTVPGATVAYDVYRDGVLIAPNVATNSHTATGLTASTQYNFYVTAKATFDPNVVVESGASNIDTATTTAGV